jgi:flagellar protein FliJ
MVDENASLHQMRFMVADKARNAALLETMIIEFESLCDLLARQIAAEELRTRINDPRHVAYSPLATAVALRRDNLRTSAGDARVRLQGVRRELDELTAKLWELEEHRSYWKPEAAPIEQKPSMVNGSSSV